MPLRGDYLLDRQHSGRVRPLAAHEFTNLRRIADFLGECADALDPALLSPADKALAPKHTAKAGRSLAKFLRANAERFQAAADGGLRPAFAWARFHVPFFKTLAFQNVIKNRTPSSVAVHDIERIVRPSLMKLETVARAQPLSPFLHWPFRKAAKTLAVAAVALPVVSAGISTAWHQDGVENMGKRIGYNYGEPAGMVPFLVNKGSVFICSYRYNGIEPETPQQAAWNVRYYKESAEHAKKLADTFHASSPEIAAGHSIRLDIPRYDDGNAYPGPQVRIVTGKKGVEVDGCLPSSDQIGRLDF